LPISDDEYLRVGCAVQAIWKHFPETLRVTGGPAGPRNATAPERTSDVFVPTPLQKQILDRLKGRSLTKDSLAEACRCDGSRLYRPGGLSELMARGLVRNKRGVGYFRPDDPPPGSIVD
jgi:hypothetical protein